MFLNFYPLKRQLAEKEKTSWKSILRVRKRSNEFDLPLFWLEPVPLPPTVSGARQSDPASGEHGTIPGEVSCLNTIQ
jgi:hypothetical protein